LRHPEKGWRFLLLFALAPRNTFSPTVLSKNIFSNLRQSAFHGVGENTLQV
jgi:hypothetical protein